MAVADRRRDHRPAGPDARRDRRGASRRADRAIRLRPDEEGPHLLEGQPAEGIPDLGVLIACPPAAARRTKQRAGSVDGEHLPGMRHRSARPRCDGAAVQPHPGRDGSAVRAGDDHPRGQDGGERHRWNRCGTSAAPRSRPRCSGDPGDLSRIKGVEDISFDGHTLHAQVDSEQPRRTDPGTRRHRGAQPGQPAADPRGAVPAALQDGRRAARDSARCRHDHDRRATTHRRPEPVRPASGFTGTLGLLRLYLRRDRIVLPLWVLLLSVPLAHRVHRQHRDRLPDRRTTRGVRSVDHGEPRAARDVRQHLQRQRSARSGSGRPGCSTR